MGTVTNIKVEPCSVTWGKEQVQTITTVADSSGSLNSDWFHIYSAKDAVHYYVWLNVNSSGVDPAPSGLTELAEIALATNATAAAVASAIQSAVNAHADFVATVASNVVTVTNATAGYSTPISNGTSSPGFTYAVTTTGFGGDLGYIDGDIEMTFEEQMVDVTAHQEGTEVLGGIRTGSLIELAMTLKEVTPEQIRDVFGNGGGGATHTPSGGTQVTGWGGTKQFTSNLNEAAKLVLHPVVLAAGTLTRDIAFWLAYPKPESITFSGENPLVASVTFAVYKDFTKVEAVNKFVYGDHTQDFDA